MQKFYDFVKTQSLDTKKTQVAQLLAETTNPYAYIQSHLINEGFLGGFFRRLSNAWNAFWQDPSASGHASPQDRFNTAKSALEDLHQMVSQQGGDQQTMDILLRGLEQSLTIMKHLEPTFAQYVGSLEGVPLQGLPDELDKRYVAIMRRWNAAMNEPDSEQKKQKVLAGQEELENFTREVEELYQKLNPRDRRVAEYKKQIENWLRRLDTDAAFHQVQKVLDLARQRSDSGLVARQPREVNQVLAQWRLISKQTQDASQARQQLLGWYNNLPENHGLKIFIRKEIQQHPQLGNDESMVFYKYAYQWMTKFPHHLARG